jgi:hypothetical protein
MKLIRVGQRCLLLALALSAVTCASASASSPYEVKGLPEIGRCVKVAAGEGVFKGGQCVTVDKTGLGLYKWLPLEPAEKLTFTGTGAASAITTIGHPQIKCSTAGLGGEWTGPKTSTVTIEFHGCVNGLGKQCSSGTNTGEIKTLPLEGELGFIKNVVKEGKLIVVVGLDLKPQPPLTALAIYECGSITETARVEGSVIGKIQPIDKLTTTSNLVYSTKSNGEQLYQKFEGGLKDTLSTTFTSGITSTTAPSTLKITKELGKSSVPLEIKAKEK